VPVDVAAATTVPYALNRVGVLMTPDMSNPDEVEGVLNPGSGWSPDGELYLLPRLVAAGNVSRVGLARVHVRDGVPVGVERQGVVLAPDEGWERAGDHRGVEDPRITWVPALDLHLMTYVAYGPLGPRSALAVSRGLQTWQRMGPLHFDYQPDLDTDLNLFPNKDVVFFPEPVPGPDGRLSFAALHRPMWDLDQIAPGLGVSLPACVTDHRPGIWISYVPVDEVTGDLSQLVHLRAHRPVALPRHAFEAIRIGAGPPPLRVPEGWLLIHHGVSGQLVPGVVRQPLVHYAAGAMILSADDPSTVLARTSMPLLTAELDAERRGTVPNVVFPTAIEEVDGQHFVFYGMADSAIGVVTLDRVAAS
jgi:predicted GH43/DUF377 family glycosyl hydrolase